MMQKQKAGRRLVLWTVLQSIVCHTAFAAPSDATKEQSFALSGQNSEARQKYLEAKRLIVNGFPDDANKAESLLIEAIRIDPNCLEAMAELSRFIIWKIATGLEEPNALYQAMKLAQQVKDLSVNRPLGDYLAAEILLAAGQHQQALKIYQEAKIKYPHHTDTFVFETRFLSEIEPETALKSAQVALSREHPMDDLSPAIADAIVKVAKSPEEAGDLLTKFAVIYPDRWLYHKAALTYIEGKKYEQAKKSFEKAIELGNKIESRLQLGILQYALLKNNSDAIATFDTLKTEISSSYPQRKDAVAVVDSHIAVSALHAENIELALKHTKLAVDADMRNETLIAALYQKFKEKELEHKLVPILKEVTLKNPMAEFAYVALGNIAAKQKIYPDAVEYYGNAITIAPSRHELYSARAHAYYELKDFDKALKDFDSALNISPSNASYLYNKSCMLARVKKFDESIQFLEKAVQIDATLIDMAKKDPDLEELLKNKSLSQRLIQIGLN